MKILGVSGSPRRDATTAALLEAAGQEVPTGAEVVVSTQVHRLPIFDPERAEDPPAEVSAWWEQVAESDAVMISTPEYAQGAPGAVKNGLDWIVASGGLLQDKPVALLSASPFPGGGLYAQHSLIPTLLLIAGPIVDTVSVPFAKPKVRDGEVADELLRRRLGLAVDLLDQAVKAAAQ